jgi:hypothetical protein
LARHSGRRNHRPDPAVENLESAIVGNFAAGNYTAIVRGKDNLTGIAVVEVYNLD